MGHDFAHEAHVFALSHEFNSVLRIFIKALNRIFSFIATNRYRGVVTMIRGPLLKKCTESTFVKVHQYMRFYSLSTRIIIAKRVLNNLVFFSLAYKFSSPTTEIGEHTH